MNLMDIMDIFDVFFKAHPLRETNNYYDVLHLVLLSQYTYQY